MVVTREKRLITKELFEECFVDKFGMVNWGLFNGFLIRVNCPQFFDVVIHMYNDLGHAGVCNDHGDPCSTLICDFNCSGLGEVASCFIDWDASEEGREYWTSFRDEWLEEISAVTAEYNY